VSNIIHEASIFFIAQSVKKITCIGKIKKGKYARAARRSAYKFINQAHWGAFVDPLFKSLQE